MICLIQAPGYCMTENSIEHFLWNPSEFTSNVVFENLCCLWIVFINSTFQVPPTENSQSSWDHTVARGYRFEVKCIYPLGSTAWGTQEFCSCNELAPHLAGIPQCSYQCLFFFQCRNNLPLHHLDVPLCVENHTIPILIFKKVQPEDSLFACNTIL